MKTVKGRAAETSMLQLLAQIAALEATKDSHGACTASKHDAAVLKARLQNLLG